MGQPPPLEPALAAAREPDSTAPTRRIVIVGVALVLAGLLLLASASVLDRSDRRASAWSGLLFEPDGALPWPGAIPLRARRVPINNFPGQRELAMALRDSLPRDQYEALGMRKTEWLLSVQMPMEAFAPLLASGRLPTPGRPEVLAGAFARAERIQVEDPYFNVVGRLKRNVPGLYSAYILPSHPYWEPMMMYTSTQGWLDPNGHDRLLEQDDPEGFALLHGIEGRLVPAAMIVVVLSIAALLLMAIGGGLLHWAYFRARAVAGRGLFPSFYHAIAPHPRLVARMHVILYAGFFTAMLLAPTYPYGNVLMQEIIAGAFTDGSLGYVGAAYASGNVFHAAAATWLNNYVVQTVGLTVGISLIIPLAGLLKTLASFVIAGFGMAPIWSGMPGTYLFHSITMILELEAYIFACVAVVVFWWDAVRMVRGTMERSLGGLIRPLVSATILCGVLLAVAALYEAATLIFLR